MKHNYPAGFGVAIPYHGINDEGNPSFERVMLSTNSPCNRRRVKRTIRRWVKDNIGRTIYSYELGLLMKTVIKHKEPMQYVRHRSANG